VDHESLRTKYINFLGLEVSTYFGTKRIIVFYGDGNCSNKNNNNLQACLPNIKYRELKVYTMQHKRSGG